MCRLDKVIVIISLLGISISSFADTRSDSLEAKLAERLRLNQRDEGTIGILKDLSHFYFSTNPLKGIEYAETAMSIAKETESMQSQGDLFNYFGNFYRDQGLLDLAVEAHLHSVEISEQLKDTIRLIYALNDLGNIYYDQKDLDKATEIYSRACDLGKVINSTDALPVSYNNLGLVMHRKGEYDMAFSYFAKALKYREDQNLPELVGHSFNYIGMVYRTQGNFRLATEYFGKALNKFKDINHKLRIGDTYLAIGVNYAMQQDYATAMECFAKAEEYYLMIENKIELTHCLQVKGQYQLEAGMLDDARSSLLKVDAIAEEHGFRTLKKQALLLLSKVEEQSGNYQGAHNYFKEYTKLKDSLSNTEINTKIARLEAAYSYRQKEKELALIQKDTEFHQQMVVAQRLRLKYLIAALSGLIICIVLLLALKLTPKQREKLAAELKTKMAAFLH